MSDSTNAPVAQEFYTILTRAGATEIVNAQLANQPVDITDLSVGDGGGTNYSPTDSMTALKRECWRGKITEKTPDPDNPHIIEFKAIIPATVGGFFVREIAIHSSKGTAMYIGNFPEAYKVAMSSGASNEFPIKMRCLFTSTQNVVLEVDPHTAIASQEWVKRQLDGYVTRNKDSQKIVDKMLPNHLRMAQEGTADLANTKAYPFSSASYTVNLDVVRDTTGYIVTTEVISCTGGFVEEVVVCDKQVNGFKIQFTGSARTAKIKYLVTGGLTK